MTINYHCRHCGVQIGKLDEVSLHSEDIGLHKLTNEERRDMISYDADGNMNVKTICEDCYESFTRNPDLHQYDYLIH